MQCKGQLLKNLWEKFSMEFVFSANIFSAKNSRLVFPPKIACSSVFVNITATRRSPSAWNLPTETKNLYKTRNPGRNMEMQTDFQVVSETDRIIINVLWLRSTIYVSEASGVGAAASFTVTLSGHGGCASDTWWRHNGNIFGSHSWLDFGRK